METFTVGTRLLAAFCPDGPTSRLLYRSDRQRVRVLGFEPWQAVTTWMPDVVATFPDGVRGHAHEPVVPIPAATLRPGT